MKLILQTYSKPIKSKDGGSSTILGASDAMQMAHYKLTIIIIIIIAMINNFLSKPNQQHQPVKQSERALTKTKHC